MPQRTVLALAAACALTTGSPAWAADAIAPKDGETVSSRPTFAFDFTNGRADIQLSHSPEVKAAGDDAGAFVDVVADQLALLYMRTPPDGLAPWEGPRLAAGAYFWHVKVRDDGAEPYSGTETGWGPTRRLIVRDEPVIFEGWTVRAERIRPRPGCRTPLRLRGKVAFDDNDATPRVSLSLVIKAAGRVIKRARPVLDYASRYDGYVCTRHRQVTVSPFLRDRAGQLTPGPQRTVGA